MSNSFDNGSTSIDAKLTLFLAHLSWNLNFVFFSELYVNCKYNLLLSGAGGGTEKQTGVQSLCDEADHRRGQVQRCQIQRSVRVKVK